MDPTDGRAYVGLGKLLVQQKRFEEARKLYDDGAAATGTHRCQAVMLSPVFIRPDALIVSMQMQHDLHCALLL